jgi:ABC-type sugar transport system substrate-binding protein
LDHYVIQSTPGHPCPDVESATEGEGVLPKRFGKALVGLAAFVLLAACGSASSGGSPSGGSSSGSGKLPAQGKIGVVVSTLKSEVIKHWTDTASSALKGIGWEAVVVDGQNDPGKYQQAITGFVNQKVAGIITISIDGAPIAPALKSAKDAGVPVIATGIGIDPSGKGLFSAFYSPSDEQLGQVTADYLKSKVPAGSQYVLLDLSAVYGAHAPIVAGQKILDGAGFTMAGSTDISVKDIIGSAGKGAVDVVAAHPGAKFLFGCCDFTAPITVPALKAAGHGDIIQTVRYDNLSTLELIRSGAPVVTAATNADAGVLTAITQILAHAARSTAIDPNADQGIYKYQVVDSSNLPAKGSFVFDPAQQVGTFVAQWKTTYGL